MCLLYEGWMHSLRIDSIIHHHKWHVDRYHHGLLSPELCNLWCMSGNDVSIYHNNDKHHDVSIWRLLLHVDCNMMSSLQSMIDYTISIHASCHQDTIERITITASMVHEMLICDTCWMVSLINDANLQCMDRTITMYRSLSHHPQCTNWSTNMWTVRS